MIAFLADIVARQETGILVVATFDTDYILIKEEKMKRVKQALINEDVSSYKLKSCIKQIKRTVV